MPTYKLGPASVRGIPPKLVFRRALVCEQCAEALDTVDSTPEFSGLSATLVVAMWPEMKAVVARHEQHCLPKRSALRS